MGLSFLFPGLFAVGAALIVVPIAIHLLNLRRQRVVAWAAMDFLLESERRNRTWIEIKRWLLLATRILLVLLVAGLVAKPQLTSMWAQWLSHTNVHHIVLLDDSYSMSDTGASPTVWQAAKTAAESIIKRARKNTSSVSESASPQNSPAVSATIVTSSQLMQDDAELLSPSSSSSLENLSSSDQAVRLGDALDQLRRQLSGQPVASGKQLVVSVLSDFRKVDLREADRIKASLANLREQVAGVQLVQCVQTSHANLTISDLSLLPGAHAAEIEIPAQVTVTNHSRAEVDKVLVQVERNKTPLPAIEVGPIAAGSTASGKFSLRFEKAGNHAVKASLPADAVMADNQRHLAITLEDEQAVLIIDGSKEGLEGLVYSRALNPGDTIATGWRPVVRQVDGSPLLSDASAYQAVLLLNVEQLLPNDVTALQNYVGGGGGLFISLGDQVDPDFYNSVLFQDAKLLPTPLDLPTRPKTSAISRRPAISVADHHLFRVFQGERNSFLDLVLVDRYFSLEAAQSEDTKASALLYKVLATVEDDGKPQPLVIESTLGKGKVICLLTTSTRPLKNSANPAWSNLSSLPIFPVFVNELVAYQSAQLPKPQSFTTGVRGKDLAGITSITRLSIAASEENAREPWALERPLTAGFYNMASASTSDLSKDVSEPLVAVNVNPFEGDLAANSLSDLQKAFADLDVEVASAGSFAADADSLQQGELYQIIACLLLGLMTLELLISYLSSYHPRPTAKAT